MLWLWNFFLHHLLSELLNINKLALFIHSFSFMQKNSALLNFRSLCSTLLTFRSQLYWVSSLLTFRFSLLSFSTLLWTATLLAPNVAAPRYLKGWCVDTQHSNAQASSSSHTFLARNICCCCRCHSCFSLTRDGVSLVDQLERSCQCRCWQSHHVNLLWLPGHHQHHYQWSLSWRLLLLLLYQEVSSMTMMPQKGQSHSHWYYRHTNSSQCCWRIMNELSPDK